MVPGEYILKNEEITCNANKESVTIKVVNTGDRPVQVGSHFHFFEVNKALAFDREAAFGKRLDILAGTAIRFEPGEATEVNLIEYVGAKIAYGASNLTAGNTTSAEVKENAMKKIEEKHFKNTKS